MWGALSDERTGLSFARVTVSSSKSVVICTIYMLYVIKCTYNIHETSVSPGSMQIMMPFSLNAMTLWGLLNLVDILLHEI
jgi:hypothetical protein